MSFNDGVGSSPKDDYIIYYNPDTYQMEWLAYTADVPGENADVLLPAVVEKALSRLPIPKPMRWGRKRVFRVTSAGYSIWPARRSMAFSTSRSMYARRSAEVGPSLPS